MRFHSIDAGEAGYAIYFPDTMKIVRGNKNTVDMLEMIVGGATLDELVKEGFPVDENSLKAYKEMLGEGIKHNLPERDKNCLPELVMHVSNDCNMRCLYCYGQGGCYNMKRELMAEETVIEALEKMYAVYPKIELINFFGGEPTMNFDVIKAACKYVKAHKKDTVVGMVTNGTFANEELVELIKEYDFRVTFSVDVQPMQDTLRPLLGGKPSYDIVLKNYKYLRERTEEPSTIEVTYTEEHRVNGYTPAKLIKEIRKDFGDVYMVFNPVSTCNPKYKISDFKDFGESVDELKEDKLLYETTPFVNAVLMGIAKAKPDYHFCGSGFGKTAVSATGDIYACQAFLGMDAFKFGSVKEPIDVLKARVWAKSDELYNHNKAIEEGKCKDCYLNTYCHRCISSNKMSTGNFYESPDDLCNMQKDVFDRVIRNRLSEIS